MICGIGWEYMGTTINDPKMEEKMKAAPPFKFGVFLPFVDVVFGRNYKMEFLLSI